MSLTTGGCLVEHDDGEAGWRHVLVGRDPLGEFVEENLHHGRVGARHDKPERIAGCRLHGREDVGDKCSACSDAARAFAANPPGTPRLFCAGLRRFRPLKSVITRPSPQVTGAPAERGLL